ncbi:signal peptidase I [Hoylesella timonensis]|uniref:Signal peptidase I n=1 Tax=Hoylesella timonensis TaxID=386414 RepID=A0A2K0XPU7_9BACT|nr:signal peptidase I [Hoylesella timonensis]PNP96534.1 signal peptidase I [Hoylesella timonensis]
MRNILQWILSIVVCTVVMLAIRAYLFTIFIVPNEELRPALQKGDRVLVNRLSHTHFSKGDVVLFRFKQEALGRIIAIPGDTIVVKGEQYQIPNYCHGSCTCGECQFVLVSNGQQHALVRQGDIIGKAYSLWRWKHRKKKHEYNVPAHRQSNGS